METLQRTANRGSISTGGYDIDNSCVFVDTDRSSTGNGANSHLHFTPSSTGNRKVGTFSAWVKRSHIDSVDAIFSSGQNHQHFRFQTTGINIRDYNESTQLQTNAIYRDTAAFYHFVMAVDTTQATAANRLKLYVNGDQVTSFSTETYPTQNQDWNFNYTGNKMFIGARRWHNDDVIQGLDGYMADVYWIDGQQLAATDFGEYDDDSGIWKPKAYSGTFGTNGCYLKFDNASDLGEDSSGNGNDWTKVNITAANQATDTPTNNFATFNQLHPKAASTTITKGATEFYINSNYQTAVSSIAVSSGKWYAEFSPDSNATFVGFVDVEDAYIPQNHTGYYLGYAGGNQNRSVSMKGNNGAVYNYTGSATGATFGSGDIVSLALDMDNRKAYWAVNGTWVNSANPSNGTNGITWNTSSTLGDAWTDVITMGVTGYSNINWKANFGGYTDISISSGNADANEYGNFEYAVPTGFYALCTKNLAENG